MSRARPVLRALTAETPEAMRLADAICWLVVKGKELGELSPRGLRPEWLVRLARAVEVGAPSRMTGEEIADRILQVPAA
ncbi:hypothetical protein AB7M49_007112 [Bradyrhizobium elkanii]|uniref:hypothetical protein n=1 Tax=Bradyrhizobium elkanii TaxID=29448 RepID=UPI0004B34778|nr:hypothetical protein [Bradyrhizobium elkanii]